MLALGRSKSWQDALFPMTDEKHSVAAILDYFTLLKMWRHEQNFKLVAIPRW